MTDTSAATKTCRRCGRQYPLSMFWKRTPRSPNADGHSARCCFCDREAKMRQPSRRIQKHRESRPQTESEMRTLKRCSKCRLELPLPMFSRKKGKPDGHDCYCRHCKHEIYVSWKARRITLNPQPQ